MSHHLDNDRHYQEWKTAVTRLLWDEFHLTLDDLPDMLTRDAFDNGTTPREFYENDVMDVMREEFGFFMARRT
jgi:hypothetical protein